ncbi:MAG TPA: PucR family transcriptional regulator ligand-binding domain-containing protein, partial [Terrimesophilobacter sp.]|nr:PucR family transcriptional regulator ligand-binding domain-containing protein [Terrimesophilobacter sp.]
MTDTATALTINDIVSTASLDVEFLAGASGGSREVLWAHSCEMPNPARWLAPHELLMTVGLCVPTDAADQVTFLTSLYDAQLAGLMIGDHETAPPLSKEMLAEADKLGFPVMLAGEQTPYAVVARHVAAANTSSQTLQVLKLSKLYHVAAEAGHDPATLITDLVSLLGVGIRIEDRPTGLPVLHADATGRSGTATASRRYPLRGNYPADLMLLEYPGEELDSFLLVHLIKVLEVAVDGVLRNADRRAEISARVMLALLNGNTPAEATT